MVCWGEDVPSITEDGEQPGCPEGVTQAGRETHPREDSLLIGTKAAWALATGLVKYGVVASDGVNQYPSHLSTLLG